MTTGDQPIIEQSATTDATLYSPTVLALAAVTGKKPQLVKALLTAIRNDAEEGALYRQWAGTLAELTGDADGRVGPAPVDAWHACRILSMFRRGEPDAYLVEGGRVFVDKAFKERGHAERSIIERKDGAVLTPLFK
ncbi:hypothetical protein WK13_34585 [Burkholderia ubonensis]|uniref:hypothetical protein n=1 Tax=Burkholderia ubonensis TaxID=101571 RepID=UPI00075B4E93|nr:hypothetical protein [Burkholderia ubonensis]KVR21667.1 hypothetical protein WK13_34585 [Burkholderia ubonensis]